MSTAGSRPRSEPRIIIVMGVSSSGKSAVGEALARRLHAPFLDGDEFHPPANKEKMRAGVPLTDADRWPWLEALAVALHQAAGRKDVAVGACSSLKRAYRDYLVAKAAEPVEFVFLDGPADVIRKRIEARRHEFMPASLLDSQLATLERPDVDELAITVSIEDPVEVVADHALKQMPWLKPFKRGQ